METKKERLFFWLVLAGFILLIFANILNMYAFSRNSSTGRVSSQASISLVVNSAETPEPTPTPTSSGGGGGGGASAEKKADFSAEPNLFKVMLKKGETFKTEMKIKAIKAGNYNINSDLNQMTIFSDDAFSLKAGEEKIVYVTFISTEDTKFDTYTGKIKIKTASSSQDIPFIIEIKSKKVLFDASLNIPAKYKEIKGGEELLLQLTLFNLGDAGKSDVFIEYQIKDFEGKDILKKEEMVAVETQASLSRTFQLPSDLKEGQYLETKGLSINGLVTFVNRKGFFSILRAFCFLCTAATAGGRISGILLHMGTNTIFRNLSSRSLKNYFKQCLVQVPSNKATA